MKERSKALAFVSCAIVCAMLLALSFESRIATAQDSGISAGVYRTADTLVVQSGGAINLMSGSKFTLNVANITTETTLTVATSGTIYIIGATGTTVHLPSVASATGVFYRFVMAAASIDSVTTNTFAIDPVAADAINGFGLTSVDDKDLELSGNVDREGDTVEILATGSEWYITTAEGTWTKE